MTIHPGDLARQRAEVIDLQRRAFSAIALHALLGRAEFVAAEPRTVALVAVDFADALIKKLDERKP